MRTLRESRALTGRATAEDLTREIINAVSAFSEASLVDDITVVAIRGIL